ncbi:hypothetical protein EV193_103260 [Herbihabitans rhizosphaerae]|uniref:Uncharacterized protein n=1 Tax=Herbihabitans rhizosphaerae TaxID=1872711 RepID=A0A4Q7KZ27_9PSEU|nr:hypothetical protein [Herbihabitans rhizosphaerae]RZS40942.1 hypothetical protein EV193_103260 [Herbihabitans rhizosphaerae]
MKLATVSGITPVSMRTVDETERELVELIVKLRGPESAHDPGVGVAAREAAELAHDNDAGLVAVVDHPSSDPAILIGTVVPSEAPRGTDIAADLRYHLEDAGGPDIREVTESVTDKGYPVVIAERIMVDGPLRSSPPSGCQLQVVVIDSDGARLAVFTMHSTTGRGWLDLASVLGELVSTVDFS